MRHIFLHAAAVCGLSAATASPVFADGADYLASFMRSALPQTQQCSRERQAIEFSSQQLDHVDFPTEGPFVLVNIASGKLLAGLNDAWPHEMEVLKGRIQIEFSGISTQSDIGVLQVPEEQETEQILVI